MSTSAIERDDAKKRQRLLIVISALALVAAIAAIALGVTVAVMTLGGASDPTSAGRAAAPNYSFSATNTNVNKPTIGAVESNRNHIDMLLNVVSTMQSSIEQRVRHEGNSGMTEVRSYRTGTKPYHQTAHANIAVMNIHNHADFEDTCGMGEWAGVLNGVEFWTRHNDYRLVMPHKTSKKFHSVVPVPKPAVPPAVIAAQKSGGVAAAVKEMQAWFKAWQDQDKSTRDYRPYFRPLMCYMEGTWLQARDTLVDPFASDRHVIEAKSFDELYSKMKFLLNSGRKNNRENLTWLPTSIRTVETRRSFKAAVKGGAWTTVRAEDQTRRTKLQYVFNQVLAGHGAIKRFSSTLVDTKFGLYVVGTFNRNGQGAGVSGTGMKFQITCKSAGCRKASFGYAFNQVGGSFRSGSSKGVTFKWSNTGRAGFVYGPLRSCWTLSMNVTSSLTEVVVPVGGGKADLKGTTTQVAMYGCTRQVPVLAQWNYRILCHPIKEDLPLNALRLKDELSVQLAGDPKTRTDMLKSRVARFQLRPKRTDKEFYDGLYTETWMDAIMNQIPGKDNYAAKVYDQTFGDKVVTHADKTKLLNVGYYNRFYQLDENDAMGVSRRKRGFNDNNMWAAANTRPEVNPLSVTEAGKTYTQRWSYAIPMEIVWMTPLLRWNPYNLRFTPRGSKDLKYVYQGRFGSPKDKAKAFNGTSYRHFFRTPASFYSGGTGNGAADTSRGNTGVLDKKGNLRVTRASGMYVITPAIGGGVGPVRLRYPVVPVSDEKHIAFKEVSALKDLLFSTNNHRGSYSNLFDDLINSVTGFRLRTGKSAKTGVAEHTHVVQINGGDFEKFEQGQYARVTSEQGAGHTHAFVIQRRGSPGKYNYRYVSCTGAKNADINLSAIKRCFDNHPLTLNKIN